MPNKQEQNTGAADQWPGSKCRRVNPERRAAKERRFDPRGALEGSRRTLKAWVRSITNPRLGVDRRCGDDRRRQGGDRIIRVKSSLSRKELADLLK